MNRLCLVCDKEIEPYPSWKAKGIKALSKLQKFCSRTCMYKGRNMSNHKFGSNHPSWKGGKSEQSCLQCDKKFLTTPSAIRRGGGKYCGYSCYTDSRKGKSRPYLWKKVERVCAQCKKEFMADSWFVDRGQGKFCSALCRSNFNKGENHYNWKGGNSYRRITGIRQWREAVLKRDNCTCQLCDAANVKSHAHHIKSYSEYPELRLDVGNGTCLCKGCHDAIHTNKFIWSVMLLALIAQDGSQERNAI